MNDIRSEEFGGNSSKYGKFCDFNVQSENVGSRSCSGGFVKISGGQSADLFNSGLNYVAEC